MSKNTITIDIPISRIIQMLRNDGENVIADELEFAIMCENENIQFQDLETSLNLNGIDVIDDEEQ